MRDKIVSVLYELEHQQNFIFSVESGCNDKIPFFTVSAIEKQLNWCIVCITKRYILATNMDARLRTAISTDIFDYLTLSAALTEYRNVRTKIGRLIAAGEIIRIKKGLYCFPEAFRHTPLEPAVIANMVYGPSYVSCDYALACYGLIPERVELVTSMTTGHPKEFQTPVGQFIYYQRHSEDYSIGVTMQETPSGNILIATPEKALYDKALTDYRFDGRETPSYIEEDLRIEPEHLQKPNRTVWRQLKTAAIGRMRKLVQFFLEDKR